MKPAVLDGTALPPDAELRRSLATYGVVVLRLPVKLTDEELQVVVARFGPVKDTVVADKDGVSVTYAERRQVIDAGDVLPPDEADPGQGGDTVRPGLFAAFHTDDSYVSCPAAATVLHARALPSSGGDTVFIDMRAAYAALSSSQQSSLRGLHAVHRYDNGGAFPPRPAANGPVSEGRALLQRLQDDAEATAPRYSHRWQPNDVLVWDNVAVQHRASADFPVGEPRRFWRYLVEGPKPVAF